jgi:hypothetical protein
MNLINKIPYEIKKSLIYTNMCYNLFFKTFLFEIRVKLQMFLQPSVYTIFYNTKKK